MMEYQPGTFMDIVSLKVEHGMTMYGHSYMLMVNGIMQMELVTITHSES
jgi:hypothetical protein